LVKLKPIFGRAHLDAIFLRQHRHKVAPIAPPIALNAANFIEKRRQYPRVGVAHAGKGVAALCLYILLDQGLAVGHGPFMQPLGGIVNIAIEKTAMVGIKHNLPDGRAGAFRHHPVDHAATFGHPGAGKAHARRLLLPAGFSGPSFVGATKPKNGGLFNAHSCVSP